MLLVVSGLMIKNVVAVSQIDYPFATKDVFIADGDRGDKPNIRRTRTILAFQDRLLERLAAQPGVRGIALGTNIPSPGGGSPISRRRARRTRPTPTYPQGRRLVDLARVFRHLARRPDPGPPVHEQRLARTRRAWRSSTRTWRESSFQARMRLAGRSSSAIDPAAPCATIVGIVPNLAVAPAAGDVSETMYVPLAQLPSRNLGDARRSHRRSADAHQPDAQGRA